MEFNDLKQLNEQETIQTIGGALPLAFIVGILGFMAMPLFNNIFNSQQAEVSVPGGFKASWNNRDSIKVANLENKINSLTKMYNAILPPFYEI